MSEKPPYIVPSMADIAAIPPNGFTAASSFSGCGGSSLGYKIAGFKVAWASEFIPAAQQVYRINHPGTFLDTRDVREVGPKDILKAVGCGVGELDLFDGSPPCASFSTAGKRHAGWGQVKNYSDTRQRTDDLFHEYIRLVKGLQPRTFVAENVSGLVKGSAKGYFKEIILAMKAVGYAVDARLLDAKWLGVPQSRQRMIFVGVRNDIAAAGFLPAHPKPLKYLYSVREAMAGLWDEGVKAELATFQGDYGADGQNEPRWHDAADRPANTVTIVRPDKSGTVRIECDDRNGTTRRSPDSPAPTVRAVPTGRGQLRVVHETSGQPQYSMGDVTDKPCPAITVGGLQSNACHFQVIEGDGPSFEGYAIEKEWDKLKPGESSGKYMNLVRPDETAPCPTICASHGQPGIAGVTHPTAKRKFTIQELRRICAFPDDFVLTGSYADQWERLGRAVPPVMMCAIATAVRDRVLLPARAAGII